MTLGNVCHTVLYGAQLVLFNAKGENVWEGKRIYAPLEILGNKEVVRIESHDNKLHIYIL